MALQAFFFFAVAFWDFSQMCFALTETMRVTVDAMDLKMSSVGPSNPLPSFFWMGTNGVESAPYTYMGPYTGEGLSPGEPNAPSDWADDSLWHDPDADGVCRSAPCFSPDMRVPLLPWTRQDLFGCEQSNRSIPIVVAESSELKVTITPQVGGRIWSVYHKNLGRELFMRLPAAQPVDYGMRKAWLSGGVEFNWAAGWCGHSVFTLESVWAGLVPTELGDMIRLWEYDRINHTTWQVDILTANGTLWLHPRVDNSNDVDLNGYWWTNAANVLEPNGRERIITPAKHDMVHIEWPHGNYFLANENPGMNTGSQYASNFTGVDGKWQRDMSWIGNRPTGRDTFLRMCDKRDAMRGTGPDHCGVVPVREPSMPYIAHALEDGFTTVHGHRGEGTKFFLHNYPQGNNFIQDFMAGGSELGRYLEIQTGVAPTQAHVFPLPRRGAREWTEWFRAFHAGDTVHNANYTAALASVETWLAGADGMDSVHLSKMESFFVRHSSTPVRHVLARGLPWGALHERVTGRSLAAHLSFPLDVQYYDDAGVRPWLELLRSNTFSPESLSRLPGSFMMASEWYERLLASSLRECTWLHELFLGTIALEGGHSSEAMMRFQSSMNKYPNPHAARNLALLTNETASWEHYLTALNTAVDWDASDPQRMTVIDAVARELTEFALATDRLQEWSLVLPRIPLQLQSSDQVLFAYSSYAVHTGHWERACVVLEQHCWPLYIHQGSDRLVNQWHKALQLRFEQAAGRKLRPSEARAIRMRYAVPRNLGGSGGSCLDGDVHSVLV